MAERRTKVMIQATGQTADGFDVPVEESSERWSEFKLEDGTIFRIKATLINAIRVDGQYDPQGNPMYVMNITPVIAPVEIPEHLRKKVQ
jgi:hypothetical protein